LIPKLFEGARLKVKRAEDHIRELNRFVESFASSPDLYSIGIEKGEAWYIDEELVVTIYKSKEELRYTAALIIGDVYHNLRSALDLLWFEIVSATGLQTKWTRFPILDTRQELIGKLGTALKKGQISQIVYELVLDTIKPYEEGNFLLWSVEEANLIDKHQLLIPNFGVVQISGILIQNDEEVIEVRPLMTESSFRRRPSHVAECKSFGSNPKVIDKGHAALGYGFDFEHPHGGKAVLFTLNAVAKEVTRTIETFSILVR
jgi:hypothetical protein